MLNRKVPVKIVKVKLHKDVKEFSVWHLLVFALVFAGIGGFVIWRSFAEETGTTTTSSLSTNIDTSSQAAVEKAYDELWIPAQSTSPDWTGSVKNCDPGTMSDIARSREIDAINFVRRLQHLAPVGRANSTVNANDMKAALLMEANGKLSHYPTKKTFPNCWNQAYPAGVLAAGESDLSIGADTVGGHIAVLMDDFNEPYLGHRLGLSWPQAKVFGIGTSSSAGVVQIAYVPVNNSNPKPDVMWPTKGYFPSSLAPGNFLAARLGIPNERLTARWSYISDQPNISFSAATVSVTHDGQNFSGVSDLRRWTDNETSNNNFLIWTMPENYPIKGDYTVTIKKIKNTSTGRVFSKSYTVHFFDPVEPPPTLKLIAVVSNNHGGTKTPHDFTLTASGTNGFTDTGDSTTFHKVEAGVSYKLSSSNYPGYLNLGYGCSGGNFSSGNLNINAGEHVTVTCTATFFDTAPRLTIIKKVVNSHGGTEQANDFTINVNGAALTGGALYNNNLYEQYTYSNPIANTSYTISEDQLAGYSQTSLICIDSKTGQTITNPVVLSPGQSVTCTITNSDQ